MVTRVRQRDGMDLLKDIRRELRGDEYVTGGEEPTRTDGRTPTTRPAHDRVAEPTESNTDQPTDRERPDAHVCSFCETEFDAKRGVCPECGAEIVLRGDR